MEFLTVLSNSILSKVKSWQNWFVFAVTTKVVETLGSKKCYLNQTQAIIIVVQTQRLWAIGKCLLFDGQIRC